MNYAIIENGIVKNIIVATPEFVAEHYPDAVELNEMAGIGWAYVDGEFIAPTPVVVEETDVSA